MGEAIPRAGEPLHVRDRHHADRPTPRLKLVLFAVIVAALGGVVGFAVSRETSAPAAPALSRPALPTPRPALSPDEQSYVETLWPVHTSVERSALRVALGASFYKLQDLSRAELRTRLDDALKAYRVADSQLRGMRPPPAFQARHDTYLTALQLFEQSTAEMLRMYDDGSEEHLTRGFPLSVEGSDKIRAVGESFWPDEYPPN
jgi:hypothetical protein